MLYSIIALIGSANASPITFYYDPAAWLAAINAFGPVILGPYSGNVSITDIITTARTCSDGSCFEIVGETSITSSGNFNNVQWGFTQLGDAADNACWGVPNCTFSAPTERILNLNPRIVGFYSLNATIPDWTDGLINGETINGVTDPVHNGFFGVVGSTSVLDFSANCEICDTFSYISLNNIQVAIPVAHIPEPSAFVCLFSAFLMLIISAARLKREELGL